jgi:hypothetical protein
LVRHELLAVVDTLMIALAAMRRYLTFVRFALEAQFPQAWYRRTVKAFGSVAGFILLFVVSDFLGIPLKNLVIPAYQELSPAWWAVIALATLVISLLLIVNGARRFHRTALDNVYLANDAVTKEYAESASRIEMWKLFQGRFDALYLLLDNRRWPGSKGAPLSREEIQWHEADFSNKLLDWFGDDYRTSYFQQLGDIPENVLEQSERLRSHSNLMHQQIQAEKGRQQVIAQRANEMKEGCLESKSGS